MRDGSDWDTFYKSGRVDDYLNYCHNRDKKETSETDRGLKDKDAEFYGGFRSGTESGAYRGI